MTHPGFAYGSGAPWGLWFLIIVAMNVLWIALAWIIVTLARHRGAPTATAPPAPESPMPPIHGEALRILNERLARSDIDEEEEARRRALTEGFG